MEVEVKRVLNKHRRDSWFLDDFSLNPYYSCDFNCVYCYVKGSKYGSEKFAVKINSPRVLSRELFKFSKKKTFGFIALSSATEPWMKAEKKYMVTRKCLEVIASYRFPVHCLTKSNLILRDLDLISEIKERANVPEDLKPLDGALVTISISTLDEKMSRIFEPGAPRPKERLETLWRIKEDGFRAGIAFIPLLPFISDTEECIEDMVRSAREYGADYVFFGSLTLHGIGKEHYLRVIEKKFPELIENYSRIYRRDYPPKTYQRFITSRAKFYCEKYGVSLGIKYDRG
ncbi:radical SAM protein [Archaeoglobales archaeon ex4484_92]|nr:MAG: radical SAM protein [Archaeoglobales archaeon ex4484_92]